jgi:hypothetical protein
VIDFRYHLVTIIAIFLALAIGIVVGTTALNGAVVTDLHRNVARLQHDNDALTNAQASAAAQLGLDHSFAAVAEPALVAGRLRGQRVCVLGLPGTTRAQRSALSRLLVGAGARVEGQLALTPALLAPSQQGLLGAVSRDVAPPGLTLPAGTDPVAALSSVLAGSLLGNALGNDETSVVVSALAGYHFLSNDLTSVGAARLVVVLAPAGPPQPLASPTPSQVTELALASALPQALASAATADGGGTALAGPVSAAGPGGLLNAVVGALRGRMVVVDGTDTPAGQVALVLALVSALHGGSGAFGVTLGDTPLPSGVLPSVLASPGPSPTASGR